jgi:DNA-binding NarL/FixJ family response regulator
MLLRDQPSIQVVAQAGDGLEALALVCKSRLDVVVIDAVLPGLNGIEVTRRIRVRRPDVKVLCLSMRRVIGLPCGDDP